VIELVVFDIAGTTVHDGDAVSSSFRAALAAVGLRADPALVNTVMGLAKPEAIRILLEADRTRTAPRTPDEINAIHDDFVRRMRDYYTTSADVREIPGASAVFAVLRGAGIRVALNTGFNREVADVLLARLGWRCPGVIDAVIASDEVPRGRPHPDMIRLLMARLNITDPRRVAKVGDTRADLEEGANVGCSLNIGVTTGSYTREQLAAYPHTHILGSVVELPALLQFDGTNGTKT
jgi:phosphonatase-like hydrolase